MLHVISINTMFTTDILIPAEGGYEMNVMKEYGKFIGSVVATDTEKQLVARVRFESQMLTGDEFTTENWRRFHKRAEKFFADNPKVLEEAANVPAAYYKPLIMPL